MAPRVRMHEGAIPALDEEDLRTALLLWARQWSTADIAEMLRTSEAAVANSIGRFSGQQEEAA